MILILGILLSIITLVFYLNQQLKVYTMRKGKYLGYHNYYRKHKFDQKRWQELK